MINSFEADGCSRIEGRKRSFRIQLTKILSSVDSMDLSHCQTGHVLCSLEARNDPETRVVG